MPIVFFFVCQGQKFSWVKITDDRMIRLGKNLSPALIHKKAIVAAIINYDGGNIDEIKF